MGQISSSKEKHGIETRSASANWRVHIALMPKTRSHIKYTDSIGGSFRRELM